MIHQYVDRRTDQVRKEELVQDRVINFLYSNARENASLMFRAVTSKWMTSFLGYLNFDSPISNSLGVKKFVDKVGINLRECVYPFEYYDTPRKIFERQIRYWELREMDETADVVSPADSKVLAGSFDRDSGLFIKDKFFRYEEILGNEKLEWLDKFKNGDWMIFRLTPDKYHYNHTPVTGVVEDIYEIDGAYNSCNPEAVVKYVTPYSKNRRVVTIINTDVEGGSNVGLVAMVEVVAMMIGGIQQCYSEHKYDMPVDIKPGLFIKKGQPKSLYRPGSSTDILIFEKGRVAVSEDIRDNLSRTGARSRFSEGFKADLVETDIDVRMTVAEGIYGQSRSND